MCEHKTGGYDLAIMNILHLNFFKVVQDVNLPVQLEYRAYLLY